MERTYIIPLVAGAMLVMTVGCQKDAPINVGAASNGPGSFGGWDTIFPGCYLPAWPGSYWTYQRLDGTDTTIVAGNWHLLANYHPYNAPDDTSHCCWIPTYGAEFLKGYWMTFGNGMPGPNDSQWRCLLPDSIYPGAHYASYVQAPETHYVGDILTVDSTVTVNGVVYQDVVVTSIHYELLSPDSCPRTLNFYACGVGMIRSMVYDLNEVVIRQEDLIDHQIVY
ncbi:MAG: hypothetical protein JNL05_01440 [Flavobacteriales bacterium]|nr:hypothetical protein [Flavobacteriales bacterium]